MKAKAQKKAGKKIEKKVEKKPAETKFGKLRAALMAKKENSAKELMKTTGFDENNLKAAISILRNPKRTKEPFSIEFFRPFPESFFVHSSPVRLFKVVQECYGGTEYEDR